MSDVELNLLSPLLFYQNPVDALQTYNGSTQVNGKPLEIFSCRGCNNNLASDNPASQYQRQKLIQNTVRVYASLYTANLASLTAYRKPLGKFQLVEQAGTPYIVPPNVNWNQMSDRPVPSVQRVKTGSGAAYRPSSTKTTIFRERPGAMSPGGVGVDIKHNSYDRYLRRITGRKPMRRGVIPPNYGRPIPFTCAYPVYGGKVVKTSIIEDCGCPEDSNDARNIIYGPESNAIQDEIMSVVYKFHVGDFVYAKKVMQDTQYSKAEIKELYENGNALIEFTDDGLQIITPKSNLLIFFDCSCSTLDKSRSVLDLYLNNKDNPETDIGSTLCNIASNSFIQGQNI